MDFVIRPHTVIVTVGPSGCGKSYFSEKVLRPALASQFAGTNWRVPNIQVISSDEIRKELLGSYQYSYKNDTSLLMAASEQAFQLLSKKLELVMSYPINADVVIVDSTGFNKAFRDGIVSAAKQAFYSTCVVIFNYKDLDEYKKYVEDTHSMKLISDHVSRLRREVMAEIRKKDFDYTYYIKQKDFGDINIVVEDLALYKDCQLSSSVEYPVIADIHGCYQDLISVLMQLDFKIENGIVVDKRPYKIPIIAGDFIDKGPEIKATIEFLYNNREHFLFILGNHENFVYKYLKGQIDYPPTPEFIKEHFGSCELLKDDPDLTAKFDALVALSKPFFLGSNFVVTHSPCEDVHLGKLDIRSLREQRNYRYPRKDAEETQEAYNQRLEDSLSFLKRNATANRPIHVFGHCGFSHVARIKNKIGIDTSCAEGNRLTAATVVGSSVFFQSVPSAYAKTEKHLPTVFSRKDAATSVLQDVELSQLEPKELNRIKHLAKRKVNFISGTMAPADKDMDANELESLAKGVLYFKNLGITALCAQPKYMGSRAEVCLNCLDPVNLSTTTSRKGYQVDDRVDLKPAYEKLWTKVRGLASDLEWLLLDVELMPWYALGKGLIEDGYNPVGHAIESEMKLLRETGFETHLQKLCDDYDASNYAKLCSQLLKEDLRKALTPHKCSCYEAIHHFQWISLEKQQQYFQVYKKQLELFARPSDVVEFRPFGLLKAVNKNGTEIFFESMTNSEMFSSVSEDRCLTVSLDDVPEAITKLTEFFEEICARGGEGIVLKPDVVYTKGVAPYMKVRNPDYLSIIYGYDYKHPSKYGKLVRQKRVARKLQTSMDEFEYGRRMLAIPRAEISENNKQYVSLVAKMILEEKKETAFDPRL